MKSHLEFPEVDQLRERSQVRSQPACFVCGQDNPHGLRIRFQRNEQGEVSALWSPAPVWEGFEGIVHGGVVSAVLDTESSLTARNGAEHAHAWASFLSVR